MFCTLSNSLKKYYRSGEMCDVTIKCTSDNETLSAHKLILAATSPYFHNALVGPLSTGDEVQLPFTSKTVKFLLDFLYQYQEEIDYFSDDFTSQYVDLMEFILLASYLDMRVFVLHGLRVAASRLRRDDNFDPLISCTSDSGSRPIPHQWVEIVVRHTTRNIEYGYLSNDEGRILYDRYIKEMSPDALRLFWSCYMEHYRCLHHLKFVAEFVQAYLNYHCQQKEDDDLRKSFEDIVAFNDDLIKMMEYTVNKDFPGQEKNV